MTSTFPTPSARVLVVIPCLNEKEHIEGVITKLLVEANRIDMKIVVADGGSKDGTRAIIRRLVEQNRAVIFLDNPKRIQSVGVNRAIQDHGHGAEFLVRVDAHTNYPDRYCEQLLAAQAATGADSVVVSLVTHGNTCFQRAAGAAQNSILGNGGAPHRNRTKGRFIDHGHHALMSMAAFLAVRGYDESFSHNEDAELDFRLTAAGFRIFLMNTVSVAYYPRHSIGALFRQYFNNGYGRARNFLKHRAKPKLRQMIPMNVAPALMLLVLVPVSSWFAVPALVWSLFCLAYGAFVGFRLRDTCSAGAGIAAMAMQAGWSFGFLVAATSHFVRVPPRGSAGPKNSPPCADDGSDSTRNDPA